MNAQDLDSLPPAVVLGGGQNGLRACRSLGRKGVKVIAVCANAGDAALLSKFCLPAIAPCDPAEDETGYVAFLMNLPSLGSSTPVLMPSSEIEDRIVSRHRERLEKRFRLEKQFTGARRARRFAFDDPAPLIFKCARYLLGQRIKPERVPNIKMGARRRAIRAGYYSGLLHAWRLLRRRRASRGLLILMYHSIGRSDLLRPGLCVSEKNFARQLNYLTRHFKILPLESAVATMRRGEPLPDNAVALTFDDGFRDNYATAFPLLKKYCCPATLFVATDPIAHERALWPNRLFIWFSKTKTKQIEFSCGESRAIRPAVFDLGTGKQRRIALDAVEAALCRMTPPERERKMREVAEKLGFAPDAGPSDFPPMLTWEQLREMAVGGVTIGSHTLTHAALPALSRAEALRELAQSKALLESQLGRPVKLFAYPFGGLEHFNAEIQNLAGEAQYEAACTTIQGINRSGTNPLALLRVGVQDDPPAVFAFKLSRFV
jgi:peptidoglycan/xylan/chitin deacetylase (PgdA/CDA1 family)